MDRARDSEAQEQQLNVLSKALRGRGIEGRGPRLVQDGASAREAPQKNALQILFSKTDALPGPPFLRPLPPQTPHPPPPEDSPPPPPTHPAGRFPPARIRPQCLSAPPPV